MGMGGAGGGDTLNLAGLLNVSMVLMYVIAVCGMVPGWLVQQFWAWVVLEAATH